MDNGDGEDHVGEPYGRPADLSQADRNAGSHAAWYRRRPTGGGASDAEFRSEGPPDLPHADFNLVAVECRSSALSGFPSGSDSLIDCVQDPLAGHVPDLEPLQPCSLVSWHRQIAHARQLATVQ